MDGDRASHNSIQQPGGFLYHPLPEGHIRILDLQAGRYKDSVVCSLRTVLLHETSKLVYEALSYTWGPSEEQRAIQVDHSVDVSVTANLWYALRRLRLITSPRLLWIDALCINQDDVIERAQQVERMIDIYKAADRVVIWLGEPSRPSMESRRREGFLPTLNYAFGMWPLNSRRQIVIHYAKLMQARVHPSYKVRYIRAMLDAWRSNDTHWWERSWIIQEAVANLDVVIQCRIYFLSWDKFQELSAGLRDYIVFDKYDLDVGFHAMWMVNQLEVMRDTLSAQTRTRLQHEDNGVHGTKRQSLCPARHHRPPNRSKNQRQL